MRELKFRVWNNRYNEFVRPDYGLIGFCYPLDGTISVLTTNYETMEDCIIEQYTGLKDKNDKEIYEGDIVKAGGRIYEVDWLEKDGGWFCFTEDDYYTPLYHIECEVIGNIHENPELLEKQ